MFCRISERVSDLASSTLMKSGSWRSSLAILPFPSTGGAMGKGACLLEPCIKSSKGSHLLPDASGTPTRCPRACTMQGTMSTACKLLGTSHKEGLQQTGRLYAGTPMTPSHRGT